jgi:hypothetical protein
MYIRVVFQNFFKLFLVSLHRIYTKTQFTSDMFPL